MNHKKRRAINQRAGCKLCKPWKINGVSPSDQLKTSELRQSQPEDGKVPHRGKDRRRWCRGKEGVEHQLMCMTTEEAKGRAARATRPEERFLVCMVCGKELEHFRGLSGLRKPAWVDR